MRLDDAGVPSDGAGATFDTTQLAWDFIKAASID